MSRIIFIHRSVGENLINDGDVHGLFARYGDGKYFCDFNQNTSTLRDLEKSQKTTYAMPGNNTHPSNYAALFSPKFQSDFKDFVLSHDKIIIKSCYPNSNIQSEEELEKLKQQYQKIVTDFSSYKDKMLIIMTSPPLRPHSTTADNAKRAKEMAKWLSSQKFGTQVLVFDFFNYLANNDGYLKQEYRRFIWLDNHPNKQASLDIAPVWIKECVHG